MPRTYREAMEYLAEVYASYPYEHRAVTLPQYQRANVRAAMRGPYPWSSTFSRSFGTVDPDMEADYESWLERGEQ